jgi:uncharacterized damage-inducible protein DinB
MELDYAPAPGTWSVGEVLDHLILSDQLYYSELKELFALKEAGKKPYLRRSFSDFNPSILFIPKPALPLLDVPFEVVNMFLPRTVRSFFIRSRLIPAEAPDSATPRPGRAGDVLRQELREGPDHLEALFAQLPNADFRTFKHYHPLLGENNVYEVLDFLTNHETVHQKQIREIIPKVKR